MKLKEEKKMITNLEKSMHQIVKEDKSCSLKNIIGTIDPNRIWALGIYGKSEFFRNEPGYTVITFLTKPQVTQKGANYELTGSQGFLIKVPGSIEKPFKIRVLPESPVILAENSKVFPLFGEDYNLYAAVDYTEEQLTAFRKRD